ncbi:MAG TPA: DUF177 domain-containing protein [Usitatibacter sp.]|nr:DUF177 domain-containing protein [Usitatibacter sp.]
MTQELLIHPERLSEKPLVFEGRMDIGEFPRLAEALATPEIDLTYKVTARLDKQRRKVVSCIIEGFVFLTCQTTLEDFRHGISIDERLVLVDDESGLPPIQEESDAEDYLVADGPVDVLDLVEDAVLLALPMVPRKPGVGEAHVELKAQGVGESPFAALAGLKKRNE